MLSRIYFVILLYIICLFLIFLYKPAMMFDDKGCIKHFSYDESDTNASLMNIEIVLCILAILCYFIVLAGELIMS
jgi:Ca2+/Na+ antiporter